MENNLPHERSRFGERAAARLTGFCGSWKFIIMLLIYITVWVSLNLYGLIMRWDPFPFILLNLTLSCLAAMQGPIILMGQNLDAKMDRRRSEYDYAVDKKAEREIEDMQKDLEEIKGLIKKHWSKK